jgi:phosphoglycolate phosphatase
MEAGRRAGVKICAVRYGYGDPAEIAKWAPDHWVSDLRELVEPPAGLHKSA